MSKATVIVPIFNGVRYLPAFFASLRRALPPGTQLILIDDGSTEPVWDTVPEFSEAETLVKLQNSTNLGYSVAVNRGFAAATGEFIFQLNTDLVLDPHCITSMMELIRQESRVGIVGSKLVFPTTGRVQHVGMTMGHFTKSYVFGELPASHPLCCRTRELQILTGATVGMTRHVLDLIGPLDETYFNMNEDIEHCLLAVRHGLRNFICTESMAYHWKSQSGPARHAQVQPGEALFWSRWGGSYSVDLGGFVDEALDHVIAQAPHFEDVPFEVLDLSRGPDQAIVVDRLAARWPGIENRIRHYRQMNNPAGRLSLPMLLPHWAAVDPTPFVYVVDRYVELEENDMWFADRRRIVNDELIVDLRGAALLTSELGHA